MSDETSSTAGFQSEIFKLLLRIFLTKPGLTPADICWYWNEYVNQTPPWLAGFDETTRKKQKNKADALLKVLKEGIRGTSHYGSLEMMASGELRLKGDTTQPEMVEPMPAPAPTSVLPDVGRPITDLERKLMGLPPASRPRLELVSTSPQLSPADVAAMTSGLADEARKVEEFNLITKNRIYAVMEMAERKAAAMPDMVQGEELWTNAVSVEVWPELNHRALFLCSSTIPKLLGIGPSVKHDFRVNNEPATHKHPLAIKQPDGDKVIRSKIFQKGAHEYYCKALEYQDGTVIKGYFVVNGREDSAVMAPRFLQIQGDKVVRVSEDDYNSWLNRRAARLV